MTKAGVPLHQVGLHAGGGGLGVLPLFQRRQGIKGEWPMGKGVRGDVIISRRSR
jgi:hypothetical protein